jgi:hypothetical protein
MAIIDQPFGVVTATTAGSGMLHVVGTGTIPGGSPQRAIYKNFTSLDPNADFSTPPAAPDEEKDLNATDTTWTSVDLAVAEGGRYFFLIWFEYPIATGGFTYRLFASAYRVAADFFPIFPPVLATRTSQQNPYAKPATKKGKVKKGKAKK